jgi:hypothetical protein
VVESRRQGTNHSIVLAESERNEYNEEDVLTESAELRRRPVNRSAHPGAPVVGHPASLLRYKRVIGRVSEASTTIASEDGGQSHAAEDAK